MAVNENYLSFVQVCKKDGVYVDKHCNMKIKVNKGFLYSMGRNGKWEQRYSPIAMPNKKRFLPYSKKQAGA